MPDDESTDMVPFEPFLPVLAKDRPGMRELVKFLIRPTPKEKIKKRLGGGGRSFSYVPWAYVARRLVQAFGIYTFEQKGEALRIPLPPLPPKRSGDAPRERDEVVVSMRLGVPVGRNPATGEPFFAWVEASGASTYYPDNKEGSYGDVIQAAQSYALRRAAARLGIALDLYDGDTGDEPANPELDDAKAAWRATLRALGLTPQQGVSIVSTMLTQDPGALCTVEDCLEAVGEETELSAWTRLSTILWEASAKARAEQ